MRNDGTTDSSTTAAVAATAILKLIVTPLWVVGVFAASFQTERTLGFAPGSAELLLLLFALAFAAHTALAGLFHIDTRTGLAINGIALVALPLTALWSLADGADGAALFWALGPLILSLSLARLRHWIAPVPLLR